MALLVSEVCAVLLLSATLSYHCRSPVDGHLPWFRGGGGGAMNILDQTSGGRTFSFLLGKGLGVVSLGHTVGVCVVL